ncbi:hypothetical protein AK812_SmicGene4670 [Symbiodinium microadriaticum]|uniref:Uncharacterized protein n=1 Tax=Symbiodinium microadriaticum TaxID=2951 RepID=A0A1Q9EVQ1_SYMMI|nr:hypothetical protein AK812_SmicGene4670 [Symbiodinium microadriaticum]
MVKILLLSLCVVSASADLTGEISNYTAKHEHEQGKSPSGPECGPSFCFDKQTANCFQQLPADVCMKAIYMCVKYMFADTKPQEFCDKERGKGNGAAIDALATSEAEITEQAKPQKMQQMPLPEAIWLVFLVVFTVWVVSKHFFSQPKEEAGEEIDKHREASLFGKAGQALYK